MAAISLGQVRLYRPRLDCVSAFNIELARLCSKNGLSGNYTEPDDLKPVLVQILDYLSSVLSDCIRRIGSRDLATFLLHMDDQWGEALSELREGRLSPADQQLYVEYGPIVRRTVQYVLERMVQLQPGEAATAPRGDLLWLLDRMSICGELMTELVGVFALAARVLPGNVQLVLDQGNHEKPIRSDVTGELGRRYRRFEEIAVQDSYHSGPGWGWRKLHQVIEEHLDEAFGADHGFRFTTALQAVYAIIDGARPPDNGAPIPFVRKSNLISGISREFRLSLDDAEKVLDPWVLSKSELDKEERVLWKSKQKNRLMRRPLMELPHPTGDHLCFSKRFARQAISFVLNDLLFRNLPTAWETPMTRNALERGVRAVDHEWEEKVHSDLEARGMPGVCCVKELAGPTGDHVRIEQLIGEVDLLHVDSSGTLLFVGEVKRVKQTFWPPDFADDKDKFIGGPSSYVAKFLSKVNWVKENWRLVCGHLVRSGELVSLPGRPPRIGHAMITDSETIAQIFTDETIVASHTRLLSEYDQKGQWGFSFA